MKAVLVKGQTNGRGTGKPAGKAAVARRRLHAKVGLEQGEGILKDFTSTLDENVRKNPWPYLGGTALGFLFIGLLLNRHGK